MQDPLGTKSPLRINHHLVTIPVDSDVERAIQDVIYAHRDDLAHALEPFGLHPNDIATPQYRQIVYLESLPGIPLTD